MPAGSLSPNAPRTIARPPPRGRIQREGLAARGEGAVPAAGLRQATGVEDDTAVFTDVVTRLLERRHGAGPGGVDGDAPLVVDATNAQLLQRFDDLDADGAHAGVHAIGRVESSGRAHHTVLSLVEDQQVRVDDSEVRVHTKSAHEHHRAVVIETVEVVAVVEVAITGGGVTHGLAGLVDRKVVEVAEHVRSPGWSGIVGQMLVTSGATSVAKARI
jgi:hypothetical protein